MGELAVAVLVLLECALGALVLSCGNQTTKETTATSTNANKACAHVHAQACIKGMTKAEPMAAAAPIVNAYTLVISAILSGKRCFTKLGNNTLPMAMPAPIKPVPVYNMLTLGMKRPVKPMMMSNKLKPKLRAMPIFRANSGASGEIKAKANKGKVVNKPKAELPKCKSAPMFCITGPMLVMGKRKLQAINKMPHNSSDDDGFFMMWCDF